MFIYYGIICSLISYVRYVISCCFSCCFVYALFVLCERVLLVCFFCRFVSAFFFFFWGGGGAITVFPLVQK